MKLENVTVENFSEFVDDLAIYAHVGSFGGDYFITFDPEIAYTFGLYSSVKISYDNALGTIEAVKDCYPWADPSGFFSSIFRRALVTELVLRQLDHMNLMEGKA